MIFKKFEHFSDQLRGDPLTSTPFVNLDPPTRKKFQRALMITDYFHMYNIETFQFLRTPDNSNIS